MCLVLTFVNDELAFGAAQFPQVQHSDVVVRSAQRMLECVGVLHGRPVLAHTH